ncbi:hypothetical protein Tco_0343795 [Tanacetum coccineum]
MTMEILPEPTSNKLCGRKIVTYRFTLTVLSALRRSVNENVIPMVAAIGSRQVKIQSHMLILDLQKVIYYMSKIMMKVSFTVKDSVSKQIEDDEEESDIDDETRDEELHDKMKGDKGFYTYDDITNTKFYGIVSTLNG